MSMSSTVSGSTQQNVFVSEVVPSLFHTTPFDFLRYLSRDGNKFLRFYWEQAGEDPKVHGRTSALGLNYDIRQPYPQTTVALIQLPRPTVPPGTYFIAAVHRPLRRGMFLGVSDTTLVVSLDLAAMDGDRPVTRLREWDKKLGSENLGEGPRPVLDDFYQAVCKLIKP